MTADRLEAHPFADAWPMLNSDELADLAADISANGLRDAVVVYGGKILDGRNRFAACMQVAVEPELIEFLGDDDAALAFVQSVNNARRHQSKGSLAASWALSMLAAGKRTDGRWAYGLNSENSQNLTGRMRADLGVIADYAPDLLLQVRDDTLTLNAAHQRAEDIRDAERNRLEEEERIAAEEADAVNSLPDDYRARIGTDYQSARVALAAWEDDNRAEAARRRQARQAQERAEAAERQARIDLHTQVITAVTKAARFGGYPDMSVLLDGYNPADIPKHLVREFTSEALSDARRFIDYLTEWQGARA